jgi:voltage-gated potassium channel Kch
MSLSRDTSLGETASRPEWWFLFGLALLAFVLGTVGFYEYDLKNAPHASPLTAAYQSLQLFVLHAPHLDRELPKALEVGRWAAAVVFLWAVVKLALLAMRKDWSSLTLLWRQDHVVICGLEKLGLPLALEAKQRGWKPVAIEQDPQAEGVRVATQYGIPVVIGDACQEPTLRRARLHRANRLFAVCAQDEANVGIAALAGRSEVRGASARKLECLLFIADPQLRANLQRQNAFPRQGEHFQVNVRGLDICARLVLAGNPLDESRAGHPLDHVPIPPDSKKKARFVITGFGEMGQSLALHAAKIGHFANAEKLQITIIDEQAAKLMVSFDAGYPMFRKICDVRVLTGSLDDLAIADELANSCHTAEASEEPTTFAVCHDDNDSLNLRLALRLVRMLPKCRAPVLIHLTTTCGFAHLLPPEGPRALDWRLRPFGMLEDVWTLGTLIDEEQDRLATAWHEEYCDSLRRRREAGEQIKPRPAEKPWDKLEEMFKESNRGFSDHLPVKLRAIGFRIGPLEGRTQQRIPELSQRERELLARMEHARWCSEHWLDGWTYDATRDDANKKHPDLVPWDKLPSHEGRIDRDMMASICRVLERFGKGVFR